MEIIIEIATEYEKWHAKTAINTDLFYDIVENIMNRYDNLKKVKTFELSVLLTNNAKMQSLNMEFRSANKPTNVLSFQDIDIKWPNILEFKPDDDYLYLGDIAFGYETIEQEADEREINFYDHFKHLLVHSILHLLGYDHNHDEEAEIMEKLEVEILKDYNIASPY